MVKSTEGVTGLEVCRRNLGTIQKRWIDAGYKALEAWGRQTMDYSKGSFCPVDTGVMKATGNIQMDRNGERIEVILYYNTEYAPTVHENPRPYHPIGQYHFLLIPFNLRAPQLMNSIAGYIKAVRL